MQSYLSTHAGHLLTPTSTSTCTFCPLSTGTEFLSTLNIVPSTRFSSLYILLGYTVSNLFLSYLFIFCPPQIPSFVVKGYRKLKGEKEEQTGGGKKGAEETAEEMWRLECEGTRLAGRVEINGQGNLGHDAFA